MLLLDGNKKHIGFRVASLMKGEFTPFKGFENFDFISLYMTSKIDAQELEINDPIHQLFYNSKSLSRLVLVPNKYIEFIKQAMNIGETLFLTFKRVDINDVDLYEIDTITYLTEYKGTIN